MRRPPAPSGTGRRRRRRGSGRAAPAKPASGIGRTGRKHRVELVQRDEPEADQRDGEDGAPEVDDQRSRTRSTGSPRTTRAPVELPARRRAVTSRCAAACRHRPPKRYSAGAERVERALELLPVEVRPQAVREVELRVGGLPEQEVRQPQLAAGADDQLRVLQLGRVEMAAELLLPATRDSARPRAGSRPGRRSRTPTNTVSALWRAVSCSAQSISSATCGAMRSRRPMKRSRTPSSSISCASRRIRSRNRLIRPARPPRPAASSSRSRTRRRSAARCRARRAA